MATYDNDLRLKEITTGDEDGTWGTSTNTNLALIADGFSLGTKQMAADANETFTMPDATADATRSLYLKITSAVSLTATREVTLGPNTVSKTWIIENATSGSQIITIKQGSGATVNVPNGSKVMVVTDGAGAGAAVFNANPTEVGGTVTSVGGTGTVNGITLTGTVTSSGNLTLGGTLANVDLTSQVTGTLPVANGGTGVTSSTGTGSVVLSNSPTFTGTVTIPTADINGGTIDGTVIGGSTAAAGTFTTGQFNTSLNVDGTATLDGLTVDGAAVFNEGGGDNDFRVESDTNTHALFLEGSSGNVGIGTSSPSSSLTVQSDSGALFADSGNTRFVEIIPPQSSNSFVGEIGTRSSHSLVLNTVNVERMRIDTSGNVGIGTSSPSSVLHVSDTTQPQITMQDSTNSSFGRITGGGTTGSLTLEADYTNTKAGTVMTFNVDNTERLRIDSSGNIRLTGAAPNAEDNISTINFYNSSSSVNLASIIGKRTAGGTNYGSLTFNTTSSGSIAERMRITSSGNVGIGTSSPTAILTLVVANNFPFLHWNNASGSNIAFAGWHGGTGGGGDFRIGATGTTPLTFQTNTTERMRINSSGNVGIGTSSPTAKLHVGAVSNIVGNLSPTAVIIGDINTSGSEETTLGIYQGGTSVGSAVGLVAGVTSGASPYFAIKTRPTAGGDSIERLRIDSSGTTSLRNAPAGNALQFGTTSGVTYTERARVGINASNGLDFAVNGTSPDVTIDSSGNLLVGKTTPALATAGIELRADNTAYFTKDSDTPVLVNRITNDGDLIQFRKNNTTVGSIGTVNGDMYLGTGDTGLFFSDGGNYIMPYNTSTLGLADGLLDLGRDTNRFKDLYLSGGVYLGGTGAANKLDDYEEGTFTPSLSATGASPTITYSGQQGFYTKIGNVVRFSISIGISTYSGGSGNIQVQGLPFTSAASQYPRHFAFTTGVSFPSGRTIPLVYNQPSSTIMYMIGLGDNVAESFFSVTNFAAGDSLAIIGTYQV
jgi:hypothetical protein